MNRLESTLSTLKSDSKKALIPFITAGYPTIASFPEILHELVRSGADAIELGMPFSDPMADGPVIQVANDQALANGMDLNKVLAIIGQFRQTNQTTPVVLMGYANPIEAMGEALFFEKAKAVGVDGVLIVDKPMDSNESLLEQAKAHDLCPILLVAPTTDQSRVEQIAKQSKGFIYYVAVKGITGSGKLDVDALSHPISMIRSYSDTPVGVGFGVSNAQDAAAVSKEADAVVVGSALIKRLANSDPDQGIKEASELLQSMRNAIN